MIGPNREVLTSPAPLSHRVYIIGSQSLRAIEQPEAEFLAERGEGCQVSAALVGLGDRREQMSLGDPQAMIPGFGAGDEFLGEIRRPPPTLSTVCLGGLMRQRQREPRLLCVECEDRHPARCAASEFVVNLTQTVDRSLKAGSVTEKAQPIQARLDDHQCHKIMIMVIVSSYSLVLLVLLDGARPGHLGREGALVPECVHQVESCATPTVGSG